MFRAITSGLLIILISTVVREYESQRWHKYLQTELNVNEPDGIATLSEWKKIPDPKRFGCEDVKN